MAYPSSAPTDRFRRHRLGPPSARLKRKAEPALLHDFTVVFTIVYCRQRHCRDSNHVESDRDRRRDDVQRGRPGDHHGTVIATIGADVATDTGRTRRGVVRHTDNQISLSSPSSPSISSYGKLTRPTISPVPTSRSRSMSRSPASQQATSRSPGRPPRRLPVISGTRAPMNNAAIPVTTYGTVIASIGVSRSCGQSQPGVHQYDYTSPTTTRPRNATNQAGEADRDARCPSTSRWSSTRALPALRPLT